jgi:lysophospholipase L1-like esterase
MNTTTKWTTMWANAMSIADNEPAMYAKDITLRYPVFCPLDATSLRFTFDNFTGKEPITITSATCAKTTEERSIDTTSTTTITFNGCPSITIPAGEQVTSDAIDFSVKSGETVSVSFYLGDFTLLRSGVVVIGPLSKGFYSVGNRCETETLPLDYTRHTDWVYFLSGIEALTDESCHTVVCYGDSITSQAWPDYLALRANKLGYTNTAVVRKAASGTRILRQYDCITYESYGLQGKTRFPHEFPVTGADTLIIQQGINDIIHPVGTNINPFRPMSDLPTATELIDGLKWYIEQAKKQNLTVYIGTLLPIYGWRTYASFREELKNEINDWIRNNDCADGFIDFDKAVRDAKHKEAFAVGFDSGDHLHPSFAAYEAMANAVPEELLK